jgi:hypothetical protein
MTTGGLVVIHVRKWHHDCKDLFYTDMKNMWSLEGTQVEKIYICGTKSVTDSNAEL